MSEGASRRDSNGLISLGCLNVRIVAGRDLPSAVQSTLAMVLNTGYSNPGCRLSLGDFTETSSVKERSNDPHWGREQMFFDVQVPSACVYPEAVEGGPALPPKMAGGGGAGCLKKGSVYGGKALPLRRLLRHYLVLQVEVLHYPEGGGSSGHSVSGKQQPGSGRHQQGKQKQAQASVGTLSLGSTSIDIRDLVTGRTGVLDGWFPLDDGEGGDKGEVRLSMDYDAHGRVSKGAPCRVIRLQAQDQDLFPLDLDGCSPGGASSPGGGASGGLELVVEEVRDNDVTVSYVTSEGWVCTVELHRFQLLCEEGRDPVLRGLTSSLQRTAQKVLESPAAHEVTQWAGEVKDWDSAVGVGGKVLGVVGGVLGSWFEHTRTHGPGEGFGKARDDVLLGLGLAGGGGPGGGGAGGRGEARGHGGGGDDEEEEEEEEDDDDDSEEEENEDSEGEGEGEAKGQQAAAAAGKVKLTCPITGCKIKTAVVAADGYTYERSAIERWFKDHSTSPMTGEALGTKALFRNYSLES